MSTMGLLKVLVTNVAPPRFRFGLTRKRLAKSIATPAGKRTKEKHTATSLEEVGTTTGNVLGTAVGPICMLQESYTPCGSHRHALMAVCSRNHVKVKSLFQRRIGISKNVRGAGVVPPGNVGVSCGYTFSRVLQNIVIGGGG
eukprot:PhF_6_TR11160/c0_g1_i7/m.17990